MCVRLVGVRAIYEYNWHVAKWTSGSFDDDYFPPNDPDARAVVCDTIQAVCVLCACLAAIITSKVIRRSNAHSVNLPRGLIGID